MPIPEKKIFVAQLIAGQQFQEVFLVAKKSLAETKAGKPYLALALMDKTGEIEARVWDNALQFETLVEEGNFVVVQAVAKPFRDQMQLGVNALQRVADSAVELADFMPASSRPLSEMAAELDAVIAGIVDPSLQALLRTIFQGETLSRFQRAPGRQEAAPCLYRRPNRTHPVDCWHGGEGSKPLSTHRSGYVDRRRLAPRSSQNRGVRFCPPALWLHRSGKAGWAPGSGRGTDT